MCNQSNTYHQQVNFSSRWQTLYLVSTLVWEEDLHGAVQPALVTVTADLELGSGWRLSCHHRHHPANRCVPPVLGPHYQRSAHYKWITAVISNCSHNCSNMLNQVHQFATVTICQFLHHCPVCWYKHKACRYIVWSGALYGCEILWPLIREEDRLTVLRKVFESKREEVTGNCRKLYNKKCHDV
jgi:hypothetical protein